MEADFPLSLEKERRTQCVLQRGPAGPSSPECFSSQHISAVGNKGFAKDCEEVLIIDGGAETRSRIVGGREIARTGVLQLKAFLNTRLYDIISA